MTSPTLTLGDVIRPFDAPLRSERGEVMTPAQAAVLSALGRCRTAALGGHLYCCDHCAAKWPVYNLELLRKSGHVGYAAKATCCSCSLSNAAGLRYPSVECLRFLL